MTDTEIVVAVARKVMEWKETTLGDVQNITAPPPPSFYLLGDGCWYIGPPTLREDWLCNYPFDPLANDADACMVLDRMCDLGWRVQIVIGPPGEPVPLGTRLTVLRTRVTFAMSEIRGRDITTLRGVSVTQASHEDADRRRALVLAALKVMGGDIDEPANEMP